MPNSNDNGPILVESERLATLESEVSHINKDVSEIKNEISNVQTIIQNTDKCLARLTLIAEQNQQLLPKIEAVNDKVDRKHEETQSQLKAINLKLATWSGVLIVLGTALSLFGSHISKAIFG